MNTISTIPQPMTDRQLADLKRAINRTYLFLISHTAHDPKVAEIMKLAALADVQRRYEAKEPW